MEQLAQKLEHRELTLSLSKDYVEHWGFWQAVREFIQNAVDADADARVNIFHDELKIDSIGVMEPKSLLLGESGKRSDNTAIGKYGEGYKLALLVLTRMGYQVTIGTGDQLWTPVFKEHPQLGTECLHIEFTPRPFSQFTTITVIGITTANADELSRKYLPLRSDYKVLTEANGKQVLDDSGGCYTDEGNAPKNIFVKGLWVCELPDENYWFSYNLTPDCIELDRDRDRVSTWDLQYQATTLLTQAGEAELLAKMASAGATDISSCFESIIEGGYSDRDYEFRAQIADMAERDFVEKHGSKAYPMDKEWESGKYLHYSTMALELGLTPVLLEHKVYSMLSKAFREGIVGTTSVRYTKVYKELEEILTECKKHMRSKPYKRLRNLLANTMLREI